MPVTPFHLGPGALVKAAVPNRFSFLMFGFAQFVIDLESLFFLVRGTWPVHRFLHTYVGAALLAGVLVILGRPLLNWFSLKTRPHLNDELARFFQLDGRMNLIAASAGAFVGTLSHVALDSIMHSDIRPLAPFADTNSMLEAITLSQLHMACVGLGLVGAAVYGVRRAVA